VRNNKIDTRITALALMERFHGTVLKDDPAAPESGIEFSVGALIGPCTQSKSGLRELPTGSAEVAELPNER
jgi:hypothetical protein